AADRLPQPAQLPSAFPSGIVTFLFSDVEGSTRLWQEHARTMPAPLARHDALIRQAITTHRGVVFKTIGDAICAAFVRPADALGAALEAQRALRRASWGQIGALKVRMALHTGVAEPLDGDY